MRQFITIFIGLVLIAGGIFGYKALSGSKKKRKPANEKFVQTVFAHKVTNSKVPVVVIESGRLVAKNRIELFAEVQGVMEPTRKEFKPGQKYSKGDAMVRIRDNDFYASLQSQKSTLQNLITSILPDLRLDYPEAYKKWDAYVRNFDMNKPVADLPETTSDKEKFFITGRNIYTTYYNTKNKEIVLGKYNLYAPYTGILTDALVTPGSLVRPGQKLGVFIDPSVYELEVAVSKSLLPSLTVGKKVEVHDKEFTQNSWTGNIIRINGRVDPTTQTVQVFIQLKGDDLREGMFLEAWMEGEPVEDAFELDRKLLINEQQVYIVVDEKLELRDVTPVHFNKKTAIVKGLVDDDVMITKMVPGAYPGMAVEIFEPKKEE